MPKLSEATLRKRRRPINRQRMGGVTVAVQRCKREGYACSVVMRRHGKRIRERYLTTQEEAETLAERWSIESGNTGAKAAASITDADKRLLMHWREQLAAYSFGRWVLGGGGRRPLHIRRQD